MTDIHVAIIGGGIGGLVAAVAMEREGLHVSLFEQALSIGEVGAGVGLAPNALAPLDEFGLGDAIRAVGAPLSDGLKVLSKDGGLLREVAANPSRLSYGVHRAELVSVLMSGIKETRIYTDTRLSSLAQGERSVTLNFANGTSQEADVVIGADGIRSQVLAHVNPEAADPVSSGFVGFRGLVPAESIPAWPTDRGLHWIGDGRHFLVYPVSRGKYLNYVAFLPMDNGPQVWSAPGDVERLRSAFQDWDPRIHEILSTLNETYWWGLYDRDPLPFWSQNRVTLLGDAAHAMLPHLGQGANQAIEDAALLAAVLGKAGPEDIAAVLSRYEAARRPRTARIQQRARQQGEYHAGSLPDKGAEHVATAETFHEWVREYDVLAEARKVIRFSPNF